MLAQAFEFTKINNVVGDYFEFGLWPLCANILETLRPLKLVCRAEEDHQ